ncbi:MAG: glycoside hydrolase family 3 C-terminal domain-containing protein, partial [Faecalibacterium sp.]
MKKRDSSPKAARIATASLSVLLAVAIGTTCGATSYRSLICSTIGGTMYKTIDKANAEPLQASTDNGMSLDEWKKAADQLVEDVTSEGIVLLKNQNQTLPLAKGSKVTLFGRSSVDLVLGGTGAGNINTDYVVDLKSAMEDDGRFTINSTIWDFYKTYDGKDGYVRSNGGYMGAKPEDIYTAEVPVSEYTDEVKQSYIDYNDAAIVVFSRVGGEASDMPTGAFGDGEKYLALQPAEEALLKEIKNSGAFDKIIAVINTSNAMELSWVDQEEYGIDACLWIGGVGQSGSRAVAKVLDGEVNPSGRLSDTYAADSFSSPAMQNFGDFTFTNADEINASIGEANNGTKYVVYREGIYVGYRYYETRYSDGVTDPAGTNALSSAGAFVGDTWNYDNEVCYPFGYGLSYGAEDGLPFAQEVVSSKMSDDGLEMQVKVTNNGTAAGKNVVELYAQQPYTCGGIEKSAVQLVGFDKTDILEPGQSETVTITVPKKEFSSYDYRTDKTYVLDAGDYHFAIGNSAHDALNNILAAQGKTVEDGMDAEGDAEKVYLWNNAKKTLLNVSYSGDEVTNRFDDASLEYYGEDTDYLTRSDWSTFPESYTDLTATADMMAAIDAEGSYEPGSSDTSAIVTGQDNQMTLAKMYGVPFDDTETWDKLLNQLTTKEMTRIVTGSALSPIPSIAYPAMFMKDGPQGNQLRTYVEDGTSATGFCGEVLRACSFNR